RALARATISIATALVVGVGLLLGPKLHWRIAALTAWEAGGLALMVLAWISIVRSSAAETHKRAASEDPGRTAVYALVLLTSGSSLLSTTVLVRRGGPLHTGASGDTLLILCLANVALS